jgi:ribonuclease HI
MIVKKLMAEKIIIYTDGSALNNPGPGGLGVVLKYGSKRREISRGFRRTTNNRMELLALITALKALKTKDIDVVVHSDSEYVIHAIQKKWLYTWAQKDFRNKKNADLWRAYLELEKGFRIEYKWVKGHAGDPENERCDTLAKKAAMRPSEIDFVYESLSQ